MLINFVVQRPIIQIPQDTITFQEIIWGKPDLIIEMGLLRGSIVFSASMLAH